MQYTNTQYLNIKYTPTPTHIKLLNKNINNIKSDTKFQIKRINQYGANNYKNFIIQNNNIALNILKLKLIFIK